MAVSFSNGKWYIDELASIKKVRDSRCEDTHSHDFVELMYMYRGKCLQLLDGVQYPTTHGDLLVINYSVNHTIICDSEIEYINILMKPEAISESMRDSENAFSLLDLKDFSDFRDTVDRNTNLIRFEGSERIRLESLLDWLIYEHEHRDTGSMLVRRSGLNMLLIQVFRKMALPMHLDTNRIDSALLRYVRDHCGLRMTLETLAQQCGYHPSYFSRIFKQYTGKTFTAYLTQCRMDLACKLLRDTELPVEDVIAECGYSDRTKFFRNFAKSVGTTPLKYRKMKYQ